MSCARVVMNDDFLPETVQLGDTGKANPLANRPWLSRGMDDVFAHRNGSAQIIWPGQPWSLSIEPDAELAHWIVFAPRAKGFICIEPISHLPNAVNMKPANAPLTGAVKSAGTRAGLDDEDILCDLCDGAVSAPCSVNFVLDYVKSYPVERGLTWLKQ